MNAVLSGRAGVALFVDGGKTYSIHTSEPEHLIERRPEEFWYLFGDAGDVEVVAETSAAGIAERLLQAANGQEILDLSLILLDANLADETRAEAAEELDALLAYGSAAERAERYLFAHPLPPQADVAGALANSSSRSPRSEAFLRRIEQFQSVIRDVFIAFESAVYPVPSAQFSHDRLRSIAAQRGLFRAIVLAARDEQPLVTTDLLQVLEEEDVPAADRFLSRWLQQVPLQFVAGSAVHQRPVSEPSQESADRLAAWPPASSPSRRTEAKMKAVLDVARAFFRRSPDWVTFFREIFGVGGVVRAAFTDPKSLAEFEWSPEYDEIQQMLTRLRRDVDFLPPTESVRSITIRLPESLHDALVSEAEANHTSMNALCISKLVQLIDTQLIPVFQERSIPSENDIPNARLNQSPGASGFQPDNQSGWKA